MFASDPRHGTRAGYIAHRRDGEDACPDCKAAESAYQSDRYRNRVHTRTVRSPSPPVMMKCSACSSVTERRSANQKFCSSECRFQTRVRRDLPRRAEHEVGAIVWRNGVMAPAHQVVVCVRTIGLLASCPTCRGVMGCSSTGKRICPLCFTEALLNDEEVDVFTAAA